MGGGGGGGGGGGEKGVKAMVEERKRGPTVIKGKKGGLDQDNYDERHDQDQDHCDWRDASPSRREFGRSVRARFEGEDKVVAFGRSIPLKSTVHVGQKKGGIVDGAKDARSVNIERNAEIVRENFDFPCSINAAMSAVLSVDQEYGGFMVGTRGAEVVHGLPSIRSSPSPKNYLQHERDRKRREAE